MMNHRGRLTLIKSVLTATATYYLTIFQPDAWLVKKYNALWQNFFWAPEDEKVSGEVPFQLAEDLRANQIWRSWHQGHGGVQQGASAALGMVQMDRPREALGGF
jgi:hypothetical protein